VNRKILLLPISIVGGVVMALLTGLVRTPVRTIDVILRGYPFPWITRVIPMRFPHVLLGTLIADVVVWAVVISVLLLAAVGARQMITRS